MASRKERDDEETKKEKPEPKEEPTPGRDEVIEIEVSPEEEGEEGDDEGEEPARAEPAEPRRQTAQDKRRQRGNAFREAQERAAQLEQENARFRAEREAYFAQQQQAAAQQHVQQQSQGELDRIYEEQQTLYAAFEGAQRAGLTEAQAKDFDRRARELEQRKYLAIARQNGMGQQVDPRMIAAQVELNQIRAKYADIYANEQARIWGEGRLRQLAAMNGGQLTYDLLDQAAEDTRRQFGLGNRRHGPPPDTATRARFSAVPARGNGGNNAGAVTVRIGRSERQLALSLYSDKKYDNLTDAQKVQKWANGPGRQAVLAAQKER